jgi:hypothetical protein
VDEVGDVFIRGAEVCAAATQARLIIQTSDNPHANLANNARSGWVTRHLETTTGDSPYGGDSADRISVSVEGELPMAKPGNLGEDVKRYGYAKKKKVKLYGKELELVSDPTNREGDDVFIDAREKGAEQVRQVQVPRNVVEMAKTTRARRK